MIEMVAIFIFSRHWQFEDEEEEGHQESNDVEMMDENIAAMVLTSLSCSPKSPQFQDLRGTFNAFLSGQLMAL